MWLANGLFNIGFDVEVTLFLPDRKAQGSLKHLFTQNDITPMRLTLY